MIYYNIKRSHILWTDFPNINPGVKVSSGGVLDFGLDGGVPPGPRDPNPCLE